MIRLIRAFFSRLSGSFGRAAQESEIARELDSHLEMHIEDNIRAGMAPDAARREAILKLGGIDAVKERWRDQRRLPLIETTGQDLRYAVRALAANRLFTACAIVTVALGVGATTAVFSVVNGVLLQPLRFPQPQELYVVHEIIPKLMDKYPVLAANAGHFVRWRKEWDAIQDAAALEFTSVNLAGMGEPQRLGLARVSTNLLPLLGVRPRLGRDFATEESQPGKDAVAMLSWGLWQRSFGARSDVIGKTVRLDHEAVVVIGVLPPDFAPPSQQELAPFGPALPNPEVFRPLVLSQELLSAPGEYNYSVLVRLRPGYSREQALAELNVVQARISSESPFRSELRASLSPLKAYITRNVRTGLIMLMAATGCVLLMICANLANLLLARNAGRRRELAIRIALGAGRGRILRQLLTESLLLCVSGGAFGILVGYWALTFLLTAAPLNLPRLDEVRIDGTVLMFALAASLATGILCGLLPALLVSGSDPQASLKSGGRSVTDAVGGRSRRLLIAGEVATCAVLLSSAGLLLGSFHRLMNAERGFETKHTYSLELALPEARYPKPADRNELFRKVLEATEALPGVQSVGLVTTLPLTGTGTINLVSKPGDVRPPFERPTADYRFVSPGYFDTLEIRLTRGRLFDEMDRQRRVALISEHAARVLWPGDNPLGKIFKEGGDQGMLTEVIGVVADVRAVRLDQDPGVTVYTPYWQRGRPEGSLVIRSSLDAARLVSGITQRIRQLDREMPVPALRSMEQIVEGSVADRRFQLLLTSTFAAFAIVLAGIGIFGVVAYAVSQRTVEIGTRMALGAQAPEVCVQMMKHGLQPVVAGLGVGAVGALMAGHALRSLLYRVSPLEYRIHLIASALLFLVGVVACYLPALRATRINPAVALKQE